MSNANSLQVGNGGICFAHGPYTGHCAEYLLWHMRVAPGDNLGECPCATDPQKPEYVAMAQERARQTEKLYTQSQVDELLKAEREQAARIAAFHDHKHSSGFRCDQGLAIAAALREGDKRE